MINYVKLVYEIRYPKMLNFKDIYKEIINPYFIYPNAKYSISDEGTHKESIRMTFPESNYYLLFTFDRISFQYDGSFEDMKNDGSHIDICFEIFKKLKEAKGFTRISLESIELVGLKYIDKEKSKIINEFREKYNLKKVFKNIDDIGIIQEGNENSKSFRVQYGPFNGETEVSILSLYSLDSEKRIQLLEKEGIIIQCHVNFETEIARKKTFLNLLSQGEKIIKEIISNHE